MNSVAYVDFLAIKGLKQYFFTSKKRFLIRAWKSGFLLFGAKNSDLSPFRALINGDNLLIITYCCGPTPLGAGDGHSATLTVGPLIGPWKSRSVPTASISSRMRPRLPES